MKKIVINATHGGFGLTPKAIYMYADLACINVYPYVEKRDLENNWKDSKEDKYVRVEREEAIVQTDSFLYHWLREDLGLEIDGTVINKGNWFWADGIERDDANLVRVVEALGEEADGRCAKLKIVEIPDNVEWVIDEYDGFESVEESHRSWS